MNKKKNTPSDLILETENGFFGPQMGWVFITRSFLKKHFSSWLKTNDPKDQAVIIDQWTLFEYNILFYTGMISLTQMDWYFALLIGLGSSVMTVLLRTVLVNFVSVSILNRQFIGVLIGFWVLYYLGSSAAYLSLGIAVLLFFESRLKFGFSLFQKTIKRVPGLQNRNEQLMIYLITQSAIKQGMNPQHIQTMKSELEKAIIQTKSKWMKKKK